MENLTGHLLIAIPDLGDPNFSKSVVLLFQHSEEGASGVVLNRPSDASVRSVWEEVSEQSSDCDDLVGIGGPVQGPLIALHSSLMLAETQVLPASSSAETPVYISLSRENLNDLVQQHGQQGQQLRIYSGYSGWGPGQLESEIAQGGWLTLKATPKHVFNTPDGLWRQVCDEVGKDVLLPLLGQHFPSDPSLN